MGSVAVETIVSRGRGTNQYFFYSLWIKMNTIITACQYIQISVYQFYDDVIKWKHFPRYWSLVRGIHRSPVKFPHKGQWRGSLMFSLICTQINGWVYNGEADDLRGRRAHYDVTVMRYGERNANYLLWICDLCVCFAETLAWGMYISITVPQLWWN